MLPLAKSHAAAMPGSIPGVNGTVITITEPPETSETNQEVITSFTVTNLPPGAFFESGNLLMSEPGTTADPNDTNHVNWSDAITWAGGNLITFSSDPTFHSFDPAFRNGTVARAEVLFPGGGDGVDYLADDGAGNITTYHIISDVPEPATVCLLGLGVAVLGRRLFRKRS